MCAFGVTLHFLPVANFKHEPKLAPIFSFRGSASAPTTSQLIKEDIMDDISIPTAPAVEVGAKSPIERKTVSPFGSQQSGSEPIGKVPPLTKPVLEVELAEMDRAWRKYRSTNSRDAVYIYLTSVFGIVTRWRRLNCALNKSRAALRLRPNPPQMKAEPFGIVIFCTTDPKIVDAKTRSKWSRVLRYAARIKPPGQRLVDFVKSRGGINECARKFARISG